MLVDTHCHIHEPSYSLGGDEVLQRGRAAGVEKVICVGTNELSSRQAVEFAATRDGAFVSIGVHPHDVKDGWGEIGRIASEVFSPSPLRPLPLENGFAPGLSRVAWRQAQAWAADVFQPEGDRAARQSQSDDSTPARVARGGAAPTSTLGEVGADRVTGPADSDLRETAMGSFDDGSGGKVNKVDKLIAIGEIGLDYFYTHSPREVQIKALEEQLDIASKHSLPVIFHVREAFDDFWPVFDNFHNIRGVLHSFTDNEANMEEGLKRGLYIGVNGISTFTKDKAQQQMFARIPLERMLLETDAPFLTPAPFRGTINEPAYIRRIADYHAEGRGISLEEIAAATTANATAVFAI